MEAVCNSAMKPPLDLQVGAFECLVKIMTLYYDKMVVYMEKALFGVRVFTDFSLYAIY